MQKMIAIAAAAIASLMLAAPANAGFLFKNPEKQVEVAALSDQAGWLSVLSDDKPVKTKKKTINSSPIARKLVKFDASIPVGTIVIDNSDRRLYHVISKGVAMRYGIAIGKDEARETVYGMPYSEWVARYQTEASREAQARFAGHS